MPSVNLASVFRPAGPSPRGAGAADGVEAFEGKAKRVDPHVALGAGRLGAVLLDQLPLGQPLGTSPAAPGHSSAAWAASRPARLRRPSCRARSGWCARRPIASPAWWPCPGCRRGRGPSLRRRAATRAVDARDAVVLGQVVVQERVIRVEDCPSTEPSCWNRSVKNWIDSSYIAPRSRRTWEVRLALLVERWQSRRCAATGSRTRWPGGGPASFSMRRVWRQHVGGRAACRCCAASAAPRRGRSTRGRNSAAWPARCR